MSQSYTWPISPTTPPIGGATAANQVIQIGLETSIDAAVTSIDTKTPTVGQKPMATSSPVVIASDQSSIPVTVAGVATEATLLAFSDKTAGALVPEAFDYQDITYVGVTTNIDQVVYKAGGAGGTTVATLTMGYDGSNRLTSVTRT